MLDFGGSGTHECHERTGGSLTIQARYEHIRACVGCLGGVAAAGAADDELDGEVELLSGAGGAAVEA